MPQSNLIISYLPYCPDSSELFAGIAGKPWSVFLDSGFPHSHQGRYDIIATDPVCTLVTRGNMTEICRNGVSIFSSLDPFELVKQELLSTPQPTIKLPFAGGAIGYFSYDLARRLEKMAEISTDEENIPEMAVGIYEWAIIVDHLQQQSILIAPQNSSERCLQSILQFSNQSEPSEQIAFKVTGPVRSNMDQAFYRRAFDRIKHYLKEGDCYQVNFSQRFVAECEGNPWGAYCLLRELNAAPFSAYLNMPDVQILSSSPERFLKVTDRFVETKPIKGTRPRKSDEYEDRIQMKTLRSSPKDRAENVMIVDLLRNDISKTCQQNSVKVPKIFDVETYTTVHHLVSTITGVLAPDKHALDLLKHCFPGGSVTGAPKIRAMEIIEELEPHRRGIYCGSIGYIGFNGNMDSNIAIRTLVHSDGTIRLWAGGGIVNDSVALDEYQECFDKAAAMLSLLQQLSS